MPISNTRNQQTSITLRDLALSYPIPPSGQKECPKAIGKRAKGLWGRSWVAGLLLLAGHVHDVDPGLGPRKRRGPYLPLLLCVFWGGEKTGISCLDRDFFFCDCCTGKIKWGMRKFYRKRVFVQLLMKTLLNKIPKTSM